LISISSSACYINISPSTCILFFFYDPTSTEIYTLSLHDALPISCGRDLTTAYQRMETVEQFARILLTAECLGRIRANCSTVSIRDRKSTRLNSSHVAISYAVFCLKKKNSDDVIQGQPS